MIELKKAVAYKDRILKLIHGGHLNESLQELWKFHDHFSKYADDRDLGYNDIMLVTSRFNSIKTDNIRGLLIPKEYRDHINEISPPIIAYTEALYEHLEHINRLKQLDEETKIRNIIYSNRELVTLNLQGTIELSDEEVSALAIKLYRFDKTTKERIILDYISNSSASNYQKKISQAEKDIAAKVQAESIVFQATALRKKYTTPLSTLLKGRFNTKNKNDFELYVSEMTLHYGEVIGLVGENATGKSTLLNIIAGSLSKSSGNLRYPQFQTATKNLNWGHLKKRISYVPQHLTEWHGSLLENISFAAALHGIHGKKNQSATARIINLLGLGNYIDRSWKELSGGYRLRFALAKALVWKPELLILDEPLAHLDVNAQITVLKDLKDLADNSDNSIAILLTSQHIHELEFITDRMLFMRAGKIVEEANRPNKNAHYEIACGQDQEKLKAVLAEFPEIKIEDKIMYLHISTPISLEQKALLDKIAENQIQLQYFRNISQSIKTKFYESEET